MADPHKLVSMVTKATFMTPRQQEIVQRDIKVLERALHGEPMPYYGGDEQARQYTPAGNFAQGGPPTGHVFIRRDLPVPDRAILEKNLQESQRTLARNSAPDLSVAAKNTLYRRLQEEVKTYQDGMLSIDQMWRPTWQNLQAYQRHKEANTQRVRFIQNTHRALEPADDTFHIEALRPEKPTPYNGQAFRVGYDQVQWSDARELALQVEELDDETYYQFLQLKALGITAAKIFQEKLGLSVEQYRACEARLAQSAAGGDADGALQPDVPAATRPSVQGPVGLNVQTASGAAGDEGEAPALWREALSSEREQLPEKTRKAVDEYGPTLIPVVLDQPLRIGEAGNLLLTHHPGAFPHLRNACLMALLVLNGLVRIGLVEKRAGGQFQVVRAPGA